MVKESRDLRTSKKLSNTDTLRMTVYASLLTALTAAGAYMVLPIGPVPIVLSNLFILLAGLLLGKRWGTASVALYLLLGAFGLPVFSGGGGGIGHILGPTGGYLLGYLPAVFLTGAVSEIKSSSLFFDFLASLCGTAVIYLCGILWLIFVRGNPPAVALTGGLLPFLPGDALKIVVVLPLARYCRLLLAARH